MNTLRFSKFEIEQMMSTGMSRKEAVEELLYWRQIDNMLKGNKRA
jgi:hypothetical protein